MKKTLATLSALAVLLLAAAVRAPSLTAGSPYMSYVDEGNFLHPVSEMLREGRWEPGWYMYPSLPLLATAAAARLQDAFRRAAPGGRSLRDDLRPTGIYDDLSPEVLRAGRAMSLLAGLGLVALAGRLARRLAGARAGWAAALLTALAPPLVIRGAIASVDPYAAFFVLAALLFGERLRTAERPGREALAAGAMAGFGFAAKYPAVLVLLVPAWILLRGSGEGRGGEPGKNKLRLLLVLATGAVAAACVAMPGLVLHPDGVWAAVQRQGELYKGLTSPVSLWQQALVRAEWDLPYDHPELGALFLLLTLAGLILALRDRETAPAVQGWCLYAAVTLLLFSRYAFHPFRNLLPLVAPACILVAILSTRISEKLRSPLWGNVAALILLAALFARPVAAYAWERLHLRDSRTEAVDWLIPRLHPDDAVLVVKDLAILPGELERLPGETLLARWPRVPRALAHRHHRFLVASVPPPAGPFGLDPEARAAILRDYAIRAHFGDAPTPEDFAWWHGNRQSLYILERRTGS